MDKNIIALLHNNLRVIIPDFGAFIIRQKQPRVIVFNEFLRYNDGLLIDYLVKNEGIDREIAEHQVSGVAEEWIKLLNSGKSLVIHGLGKLQKDTDGKIIFTEEGSPEESLTPERTAESISVQDSREPPEPSELEFITAPVSDDLPEAIPEAIPETILETIPEAIPETIPETIPDTIPEAILESIPESIPESLPVAAPDAVPETAADDIPDFAGETIPEPLMGSKESSVEAPSFATGEVLTFDSGIIDKVDTDKPARSRMGQILFWVILFLTVNAIVIGWFVIGKGKPSTSEAVEPLVLKDSLYDQLADSVRDAAKDTQLVFQATPVEEAPAAPEQVKKTETPAKIVPTKIDTGFYIVLGSFRDEANADTYLKSVKKKGLQAKKLIKSEGLYSVCVGAFDSREKADTELARIREKIPGAWISRF